MGNTLCYAKNFLKLIFVGVELIYNVVFISGVQQSESVTQIHISTCFRFFSHIGHYTVFSLEFPVAQCKESICNAGDPGSIHGKGHGNPLQYSCLGNPHGQRSLAGYSSWSHKELDMT